MKNYTKKIENKCIFIFIQGNNMLLVNLLVFHLENTLLIRDC